MSSEMVLSVSQEVRSSGLVNVLSVKHGSFGGHPAGSFSVYYEHVGIQSMPLAPVMDGYLFGILFFAMRGAKRIVVEGPITDLAIRNAWHLGEAWHNLLPDTYQPVPIEPEEIICNPQHIFEADAVSNSGAIAAFSGGVDSMFTALRHTDGSLGTANYPLSDLVMVHGFDVSLENQSAFDELTLRTAGFVNSLELRRRIVKTNLKIVTNQNWEHSFSAQLASVLHQFSNSAKFGLIGSGSPYTYPNAIWGSQPGTDFLLSGSGLSIVHDGAGYSRQKKVERLSKNMIARQNLKVCWEGVDQGRNCGFCEKCIRTKLNFLAAGIKSPECFQEPLTIEDVHSLRVRNLIQLDELQMILEDLDPDQFSDPRFEALRRKVADLGDGGTDQTRSNERDAQITGLASEIGRLQDRYKAAKSALDEHRQEITKLTSSKAFRLGMFITWPVRLLRSAIAALKRRA